MANQKAAGLPPSKLQMLHTCEQNVYTNLARKIYRKCSVPACFGPQVSKLLHCFRRFFDFHSEPLLLLWASMVILFTNIHCKNIQSTPSHGADSLQSRKWDLLTHPNLDFDSVQNLSHPSLFFPAYSSSPLRETLPQHQFFVCLNLSRSSFCLCLLWLDP